MTIPQFVYCLQLQAGMNRASMNIDYRSLYRQDKCVYFSWVNMDKSGNAVSYETYMFNF